MADSSTQVASVTTKPPSAATSPTLIKVLQTRATAQRLLRIIENQTTALEPQDVGIHSISQTSLTLSFYGVTPAETDSENKSHINASTPSQQYATIPFASPLPSDPQDPSVKFDEELVSEMVSRIVTLSSIPPTSSPKGKKIVIKVERYLPPDSIISYGSMIYYIALSLVLISWLARYQIADFLGITLYSEYPIPESWTDKLVPQQQDLLRRYVEVYYAFLGARLFGTDFKFKMIGMLHAWVAIGRIGAMMTMKSKLRTYKVDSWGTWLAWMATTSVEGRPCVDRFQDEVRRLWIEGMEKDKKEK